MYFTPPMSYDGIEIIYAVFLSIRATCDTGNNATYTIMMTFYYPYHPPSYTFTYDPAILSNSSSSCFTSSDRPAFTGSAEYFVALSSFSFVFAILSFPFYFVFYVPRYDLAKYLSIIVSLFADIYVHVLCSCSVLVKKLHN